MCGKSVGYVLGFAVPPEVQQAQTVGDCSCLHACDPNSQACHLCLKFVALSVCIEQGLLVCGNSVGDVLSFVVHLICYRLSSQVPRSNLQAYKQHSPAGLQHPSTGVQSKAADMQPKCTGHTTHAQGHITYSMHAPATPACLQSVSLLAEAMLQNLQEQGARGRL